MSQTMPGEIANLCLFQRRFEPIARTRQTVVAPVQKDWPTMVASLSKGLKSFQRRRVKRDVANFAVLRTRHRQDSSRQVHGIPRQAVELTQAQSCVQCDLKFGQVFGTSCLNDGPYSDFLFGRKEANPGIVLRSMLDEPRRIFLYLLVANTQAVHEREQGAGRPLYAVNQPGKDRVVGFGGQASFFE